MREDKSKASNKICSFEASFSRKLNLNMFSQVSALHAYDKSSNLFLFYSIDYLILSSSELATFKYNS